MSNRNRALTDEEKRHLFAGAMVKAGDVIVDTMEYVGAKDFSGKFTRPNGDKYELILKKIN